MKDLQKALDIARKAAICAAAFTSAIRSTGMVWDDAFKDGNEPFTQADLGSQAIILKKIHDSFPEHGVIAEESSEALDLLGAEPTKKICDLLKEYSEWDINPADLRDNLDWRGDVNHSYIWTVDPIDGTKGYIAGLHYAVAISMMENGTPVLGVIAAPHEKMLYWATRDGGAWKMPLPEKSPFNDLQTISEKNISPVRVTEISLPEEAAMLGSRAHVDPLTKTTFESLHVREMVKCDSQIKYSTIADGRAELYLRPETSRISLIWDHAPGVVILEEAGGKVTDIDGRNLDFSHGKGLTQNHGILATNGKLHEIVLSFLKDLKTSTDSKEGNSRSC